MRACRAGGAAELGIRDGLLQHALAVSDTDQARRLAEETQKKSIGIGGGLSYYGLWHLLTRVKWLYRIGDANAGLAVATDAIPHIERMADRNLLERMTLLAAEGLGRVGRPGDGAALMAEAVHRNPDPPLEMIAEAARIAGRLAAHDDRVAALGHFERAARILRRIGNRTGHVEIERDAAETTGGAQGPAALVEHVAQAPQALAREARGHAPRRRPPDLRPPAAPLVERVAALADLAAHPPLLATEVLALLAATHAAQGADTLETWPDGHTERLAGFALPGTPAPLVEQPRAIHIPLGTHRDRRYAIVALPREAASARATLLALERVVQTAVGLADARQQERERAALWPEPTPEQQLGLVCAAESMLDLIKTTRRVAASNVTVLLSGETGVGKELFARALHHASARQARVFQPFNCATVPRDMLESQLFGYRRGAFTGAQADAPGIIRGAAGGTLFLDEVGEMSLDAQPKLLRFLESGEILPLGEPRPQLVDVRIVAATNADLDRLVAEGRFREDLYYRLNVIHLRVPPLRERREEIPVLVDHFVERFAREMQRPMVRVSADALEYLVLYRWPGNVRQLANEIRRVVTLAEAGAVVMPEHLSHDIFASRRSVPVSERALGPTEMLVRLDQPIAAAIGHVERALIRRALAQTSGNGEEAARILGLSRKGLYLKRRRHALE